MKRTANIARLKNKLFDVTSLLMMMMIGSRIVSTQLSKYVPEVITSTYIHSCFNNKNLFLFIIVKLRGSELL